MNVPLCNYCASLDQTVEKYGRVTHTHTCPNRKDPWCQTHPDTCPALVGLLVDAVVALVKTIKEREG